MKQVQSLADSPHFGKHSSKELLNSSDCMRLGAEDFQNLPSQALKAQYNEMLHIANKIHMLFKGKLMLSFYKQHKVSNS